MTREVLIYINTYIQTLFSSQTGFSENMKKKTKLNDNIFESKIKIRIK